MGSDQRTVMPSSVYAQCLEAHYARTWAGPMNRVRMAKGPVGDLPSDFEVIIVPRSEDTTAYATVCMSQSHDAERLELHLLTRSGDEIRDELVEILTAVVHYHRTGQTLGLGHSVNFGKPWFPRSRCTHGVISLPYLDGPELEWLAEPKVRFLWLIPVTEAEVAYKKRHGMEALEQRFEAASFDYLDPTRASVVPD